MVPARAVRAVLFMAAVAGADVAVPETGPVFRGSVHVDEEKGEALLDDASRPLSEILLVEKDDGTLVWCDGFDRRAAGYRRLVYEEHRDRLVELIKAATKARDPELARRLLEQARAEGFSGKEEDIQRRRVENLEKHPGKRKDEQAEQVAVEAAALANELPDLLLARAKSDTKGDGPRLLREALRAKPDHEAALAMLKERARKPHPFGDDRIWLDWAIEFESRGFRLVPDDDLELKRARHYWRPDLIGVASPEVEVLTPLREMEPLREVALRAHLACAKLREMFRTDTPLLRPAGPILLYLEVNKDNFKEQQKSPVTNPLPPYFQFAHARWDLLDDITRVLWSPAAKERNDIRRGAVHEIVRHWLWSRNPRTSLAETNAADPNIAGYWAEVGLWALLADARYDLDGGRVDLEASGQASRAFVRDHAGDLLPWNAFFLYGRHDLHLMNKDDAQRAGVWASDLFEKQATTLCHYLLCSEGGKRRAAFLDFFVYRSRGVQPKLAPGVAFGMSADELGAAAVKWAAR